MTVTELIKQLQQYKPDAEIRVYEGHVAIPADTSGIVIIYAGKDAGFIETPNSQ